MRSPTPRRCICHPASEPGLGSRRVACSVGYRLHPDAWGSGGDNGRWGFACVVLLGRGVLLS